LKNTAQEFRPSICVCRNGSTSERRFGFALTSHGASLRVETEDLRESRFTTTCIINATSYKRYNEKFRRLRSHLSYTQPLAAQRKKLTQTDKVAKIWPGRKFSFVLWKPGFSPTLTTSMKSAQAFGKNSSVRRNRHKLAKRRVRFEYAFSEKLELVRHTRWRRALTNDITNAGLGNCRKFWNLYIHLCWLENAVQFSPALVISSAVVV
jgi:hypothetical protein